MIKNKPKNFYSQLLYTVHKDKHNKEDLKKLLNKHPQIQYVSLVGIDLRGNDTDEKIPVKLFLDEIDNFLSKGIQTDGSSVVLQNIATLNNAKVDIIPDLDCVWFVDYNFDYLNDESHIPVGTLRIPSYLVHDKKRVCSRSVLKRACENFKSEILNNIAKNKYLLDYFNIPSADDIDDIILTCATELEFWVQTPDDKADEEKLSTSQTLKEQYWKKTQGTVRTALEKTMWLMDKYDLSPEMGHKEVGGVVSTIGAGGKSNHVMEQLEIDWKYSDAMQCADNDLLIRSLVVDVFHRHGLEVSFHAKPIEGVAGSGKHTHIGGVLKLKNGDKINVFAPQNMKKDYVSPIGFGSLMGILKNYEIINPIAASSNDSLNRLKSGFEAPVCIVSSIGQSSDIPSRNRSILIGLIKDIDNPLSTRFELRSPNPLSNTYLIISACYQTMLDGVKYAIQNKKASKDLEIELSKTEHDFFGYLEKGRAYRSEENVFDYYDENKRNELFGIHPKTVWENAKNFDVHSDKIDILTSNNVFSKDIINSFKTSIIDQWVTELTDRIISENSSIVKSCERLHCNYEDVSDLDVVNWEKIQKIRSYLMKDKLDELSLFTRIKSSIYEGDFDKASDLQIEMNETIRELKELYTIYKKNLF